MRLRRNTQYRPSDPRSTVYGKHIRMLSEGEIMRMQIAVDQARQHKALIAGAAVKEIRANL